MLFLFPFLSLVSAPSTAPGSDWWNALRSVDNLACCDHADGEDVLWEGDGKGGYRILINGKWVEVPARAMVTQPNKYGTAVVWLDNKRYDGSGALAAFRIRCFMPGAGL